MFWAKAGSKIDIADQSPERVWLDISLGNNEIHIDLNMIQVSVCKADLLAALERWQAGTKVASHA